MDWLKNNWQAIVVTLLVVAFVHIYYKFYTQEDTTPDGSYWIEQHNQELQELKADIYQKLDNLEKRYENIDTITTSDGANAYIDDFRDRTGDRLPPRRHNNH